MSRIVHHRDAIKAAFKAQEGIDITYTSYFIQAAAKALKEFPLINASVDGYNIIIRKSINVGFAVELPGGGLIVPVIKGVDGLSLTGIAKGLNELAEKARANRLDPSDISGGTFTITNIGVFGNITGAHHLSAAGRYPWHQSHQEAPGRRRNSRRRCHRQQTYDAHLALLRPSPHRRRTCRPVYGAARTDF